MEKTLRNIFSIIIPAGILSLTYFLWRSRNDRRNHNGDEIAKLPMIEKVKVEEEEIVASKQSEVNTENLHNDIELTCSMSLSEFNPAIASNISNKCEKRIRQESTCDSAFVEDYSSDGLSLSGSDSAGNKSQEIPNIDPVSEELQDSDIINLEELENCHFRDWYYPSLDSSEQKVWNWGSEPMSDIELDSQLPSIKQDQISGASIIDQLAVALESQNQRLTESQKPKLEKTPKSPKVRSRRSEKNKSPKVEKMISREKETTNRKSRTKRKSNERKDIEKPWRDQSLPCNSEYIVKEYELPEDMCGKIIGKHGKCVKEIYSTTGATVCIEQERSGSKRIVSIAGLNSKVKKAEDILLPKFKSSLKLINHITFSECTKKLEYVTLPHETYVNVIVTAIVDAGNFFVQIYKKEVDEILLQLQTGLSNKYGFAAQKLKYSEECKPNVKDICVGLVDSVWCRLEVLEYLNSDEVSVSFIDYGGVVTVPWQILLRISDEFLQMPGQGIQCYLSNVFPFKGEEGYSYSANMTMNQLIEGRSLKAYVQSEIGKIPCVELLYFNEETNLEVSINQSLVKWGLTSGFPEICD